MWVAREKVDKVAVVHVFRKVLLFRENIDLGYCFGSVESTGVWPAAAGRLFDAAKELLKESDHHLHTKLQVWNVTKELEDLDEFRTSQILCTMDRSRWTSGEAQQLMWKDLERCLPVEEDGGWSTTQRDMAAIDSSPWDLLQTACDLGAMSGSEQGTEEREPDLEAVNVSCSAVVALPTLSGQIDPQ